MPIYSMTGFARVQVRVPLREQDQLSYTLTVKSVNHRFLDLQLRLPAGMDALEMELRKVLKDNLVRGHVDLTLVGRSRRRRRPRATTASWLRAILRPLTRRSKEHGLKGEPDLNAVLRLPGALQAESRGDGDLAALAESVLQQIGPLLEELKAMRAREGESLDGDSARNAGPAWRSNGQRGGAAAGD